MRTNKNNNNIYIVFGLVLTAFFSCRAPKETVIKNNIKDSIPERFSQESTLSNDTIKNSGLVPWKEFFTDPALASLIEEALRNNQDLLIALQEIEIAQSNVMAKRGSLAPSIGYNIGAGVDKAGRYTSEGAGNATTEIKPGRDMPDPLMDYQLGVTLSWEADIWGKLKTEKKAAVARYLSTVEGKNFVLSTLISEIASKYYELLSLDNQLEILNNYIKLQERTVEISKIQKEAAATTELAVKQFEADLAKQEAQAFTIQQSIVEKENEINILLGRYPQPIARNKSVFLSMVPNTIYVGIPSQLLENRPDVKQAELELKAAKLDVSVARKEFYPSLNISAALGLDAFNPSYLFRMPKSIAYNAVAGLAGPLINKSAIQAQFRQADAAQIEALYGYQKTILQAYIDICNQMSKIKNTDEYYKLKLQESQTLDKSIDISIELFKNSRANYLDVLTVQRDALDARFELIQAKEDQLNTVVYIYKSLGGGW